MSPASSTKEVRFATPDPESPYLYPGDRPRTGRSPLSPDSLYFASPNAPSLSYTPDFEDEMVECPPTPLLKPKPLVPESEPSLFSPNSSTYAAYYEIDCIMHELNQLSRSYHLPTELDFELAPLSSRSAPGLPYTAKNRPFLEHNQKLEKLQERLDAIMSHGDDKLKMSRKAAGAKVRAALDELKRVEAMIRRRWDNACAQRMQRQF